ncbi:hypothetical protein CAOG_01509 [Capsaspora owczarzaki ATCC 30864]|uniref:Cysteine protease n=1 Tax=Capsaspora owczarzaki (strain ATCC 30864) TaxID=595528 RepID=A0A0D2VJL4_CAPO3|nr:hypothetical protein CAOG_01509 [Capsaspora owczarzaki ATCC 30864]KJE90162.1 hypothetical protein CAOG_001509 [Capsaspora owczarzaki ATCC 30864]|eukprot:XP_004364377.1 hypothetical protein CAOG_01509 [Capsaspora owczarzaki ATCC 30864]
MSHNTTGPLVTVNGHKFQLPADEQALEHAVRSFPWMTYRNHFAQIADSYYNTDAGWGCMLRCGQMLLARAMTVQHLGKNWAPTSRKQRHQEMARFLPLFFDTPAAPFSIHRIAERGEALGKTIGQWFGPNTVAQVLKNLVNSQRSSLIVHCAMDGVLNRTEASTQLAAALSDGKKHSLLVLVPIRLGLNQSINPVYIPALKATLELPQCLGIIGGKPNAAHFFVGTVNENVLYLDPHVVQDAAMELTPDTVESFSVAVLSKMAISDVDPSMCAAYLCSSVAELEDLGKRSKQITSQFRGYGLFDVIEDSRINSLSLDSMAVDSDDGSDEDDFDMCN